MMRRRINMAEMKKEIPKRSEVPEELTWDLETIFKTDDLWEEEFEALKADIPKIKEFQNTFRDYATQLANIFKMQDKMSQTMGKLFTYAHMRNEQATTNDFYQSPNQKAQNLLTLFS